MRNFNQTNNLAYTLCWTQRTLTLQQERERKIMNLSQIFRLRVIQQITNAPIDALIVSTNNTAETLLHNVAYGFIEDQPLETCGWGT